MLVCDFCSNFKAYDTSVMLALKRFNSSLVLAFKSPNKRICSFFALLFLLIHEKYRVLCFETSKFETQFATLFLTSRLVTVPYLQRSNG